MVLTYGGWIIFWVSIVICIILGLIGVYVIGDKRSGAIIASISIAIVITVACISSWYNTNTEQGKRNIKDAQSEINGGLNREITIYSEEGREIYSYEGKFDLKVNQDSRDLEFVDNNGKKHIIIFGIQDTAIIIEK
ncbi:MAG: hypothetical protein IJ094_13045 [Bacilli bacterium]|nr:hypothetical protein [Bacilli bacterium]